MVKKTEELVKQGSQEMAGGNVPDYLKKYAGNANLGMEQMTSEDYVMPRLAIAQAMSPQVTKGDALFVKGLEPGHFFNTLTGENYGEGPLLTVPLFSFKNRIFFPPRGSDGTILCATKTVVQGRLVDGAITPEGCDLCPHSQWLPKDRPRADGSIKPDCTYFVNYVVALPDKNLLPLALSLKSKMLKPAKSWNSKIRYAGAPAFTQMYDLGTVPEKAPKGTFFNITINPSGFVSPEVLKTTEQLFKSMSNREVKYDTRGFDNDVDDMGDREINAEM